MLIYTCEIGILLPLDKTPGEIFSSVYDKKYGYYEVDHFNALSEKVSKQIGLKYLEEQGNGSYCVVSAALYDCDERQVKSEIADYGFTDIVNGDDDPHLKLENVVYCCYNDNGVFIEDFMEKNLKPTFENL